MYKATDVRYSPTLVLAANGCRSLCHYNFTASMPNIKSAIKRVRQTAKRRSRNLAVKRAVKNDTQAVLEAVRVGDAEAAAAALRQAVSELDRAVKKGTLHQNTAGRRKSRLSKQVSEVAGSTATTKKPSAAGKAGSKATAKATAKKTASKKPAAKAAAKKPAKKTPAK